MHFEDFMDVQAKDPNATGCVDGRMLLAELIKYGGGCIV